jgi:hypothetical protein
MKKLCFLAAAVLATTPAWAFQTGAPIVLRARGQISAQVASGKPLPAGAFTLKQGDILMLLDGKGVRVLNGPGDWANGRYTRTGGDPSNDGRSRVGGLRGGSGDRARIAASRGPGAQPWVVDLASTSTVCLPSDRQLVLWRRAGPEFEIEVQPAAGGAPGLIEWPAFAEQVVWPQDWSTAPGARYRLNSTVLGGSRELQFRELDAADPACAAQVDLNFAQAEE